MSGSVVYKTQELLERTGISRQVLHQYVTMGLVKEAERTEGGHRLYDDATVKKIVMIQKLNKSGYTLRDIRDTFKSGMEQ